MFSWFSRCSVLNLKLINTSRSSPIEEEAPPPPKKAMPTKAAAKATPAKKAAPVEEAEEDDDDDDGMKVFQNVHNFQDWKLLN